MITTGAYDSYRIERTPHEERPRYGDWSVYGYAFFLGVSTRTRLNNFSRLEKAKVAYPKATVMKSIL